MSLLENIVPAAPLLTAQPLAASDMHWEWVATNSQRILELTLSHLYQGVVPVAIGTLVALPVAYYASRRRDRGSERRIGARTLMHLSSLLYTIPSIPGERACCPERLLLLAHGALRRGRLRFRTR